MQNLMKFQDFIGYLTTSLLFPAQLYTCTTGVNWRSSHLRGEPLRNAAEPTLPLGVRVSVTVGRPPVE